MKQIALIIFDILMIMLIVLIILIMAFSMLKSKHVDTDTTQEQVTIDSVLVENDKIIESIDSIIIMKDGKIKEVTTLDNDSTLKLFYELIGK